MKKKLLNLETQNIKVVPYDIGNSQLRLAKNLSSDSAFWTGLVATHVNAKVTPC